MQKIWAYLELVLNSAGLRVKLKKVGGLFSKKASEPVSSHVDRQILI